MSVRAYTAVVRLAVVQGRTGLLISTAITAVAWFCVLLLSGPMKLVPAGVALFLLLGITVAVPLASLAKEKMLGNLDLDRTLPVPLRTLAAGRLTGAAVRTLPVALGLAVFWLALIAQSQAPKPQPLAVALLLALLAYWILLWIAYALVSRFSTRRLIWFPGVVWIGLMIMPPAIKDAIGNRASSIADVLLRQADPPGGALVLILLLALIVAALVFTGATLVLMSGLARFEPDPSAMAGRLEAAPKRELMSIGRGPLLAVARLRLRLATAQFRREMMLAAALVVIIVPDLGALADFARTYLPILAAFLPAAVALQLAQARVTGSLEGMQQLPNSRRAIAFGHMLAVMVLAVPAVVIIAVSKVTDGIALDVWQLAWRWFLFVAIGAGAAAFAVWGTLRRFLALLAILVAAPIALIALGTWLASIAGIPLAERMKALSSLPASLGAVGIHAVQVAAAIVVVAVATELFARGLATFQPSVVK